MKPRDIQKAGIPYGPAFKVAARVCATAASQGMKNAEIRLHVNRVGQDPAAHIDDAVFGELARALIPESREAFTERESPAPWQQWGDDLDRKSIEQMRNACRLPISVRAALMPDAHLGYGLPIGGVLATDNAVIPYAVGVDIACRMMLTVTDMPVSTLKGEKGRLVNILEEETRFGMGAAFENPHDHEVIDRDWSITEVTKRFHRRARSQLGTSGTGNHFVEYGEFTLSKPDLELQPGTYLAILSHSGSRGPGANVCKVYSRRAMDRHPDLPKPLKHLAWLDLDTADGQEYWAAMELMGDFASANHHVIHREMVRSLKCRALAQVENHHNFAWKEMHDGRELVVHRKGATPAGEGVLGVIPGSMASPAFVVRGKGSPAALESAAHGAGRVMSRRQAMSTFTWSDTKKLLADRGVTLLSAGLDEVPGVYKDIHQVMRQQEDLVEVVAQFDPRIVKMAPPGEKAED
jgi:tRNA-splicing ligase RtcB